MKAHRRVLRKGFTLIELMVVVAIIGILMAAGIVAFSKAQQVSRDAKRKADVDAMSKGLEQYFLNNGQYPTVGRPYPAIGVGWNDAYQLGFFASYFPSGMLPLDPLNSATDYYAMSSVNMVVFPVNGSPSRFCVSARLEVPIGNCTGQAYPEPFPGSIDAPSFGRCTFVTGGTGTHYCASSRQ